MTGIFDKILALILLLLQCIVKVFTFLFSLVVKILQLAYTIVIKIFQFIGTLFWGARYSLARKKQEKEERRASES